MQALSHYSEFLVFAGMCAAAFGMQGIWLWKTKNLELPWIIWLLAVSLLAVTWLLVDQAGTREQQRIERVTGDFARLYGDEMQRLGHSRLDSNAAADDPLYLELIETQKRWLTLSPLVNDIYTLRERADGRFAFLVDSETDYNRDGKYEGEREHRTPIGEVYEEADAPMTHAFRGNAGFASVPVSDRWGKWVSAYVPLLAPDGRVEGILGVDFDAANFTAIIAGAKWNVIGLMAVVQLILLGSSTVTLLLGAEAAEKTRTHETLRKSEERFREMASNIREIFWMRSPGGEELIYISPAYEQLWGRTCASAYAEPQSWSDAIVAEDRSRLATALAGSANGENYDIDYRIIRPDGSLSWMRDRGFPVRDQAGKVVRVCGIVEDITARKQIALKLEQTNIKLLEVSRRVGMAEVATGILHNVGNVLNSVNVASACIGESIKNSKVANLVKVVALLRDHKRDMGGFLTANLKGKQIPDYLEQLAEHLSIEQSRVMKELLGLQRNIAHINEIVTLQQGIAKLSGSTETLAVNDLMEDALKISGSAFERHDVTVIKEFQNVPSITVEKHRVLQILVNLVNNARQACEESEESEKRLILRVTSENGHVRFAVNDNGIGISPENLAHIFEHGFTTKPSGHGFGLHSGALAAKEMGGSLNVQSDGFGKGATFTLELPLSTGGRP